MKISRHLMALAAGAAILTAPASVLADDTPAKETISQEAPVVKAKPGGIEIQTFGDDTAHVTVYALTGQVVKQLDVQQGSTYMELPAGYYIVRIGLATAKVVVK